MPSKILPSAIHLTVMNDDELREELCKDIYNNANLREMVRRLAKLALEYAMQYDAEHEKIIEYRGAIRRAQEALDELGREAGGDE